eukprot:365999-Chlamydomonas_euryale.AAC.4
MPTLEHPPLLLPLRLPLFLHGSVASACHKCDDKPHLPALLRGSCTRPPRRPQRDVGGRRYVGRPRHVASSEISRGRQTRGVSTRPTIASGAVSTLCQSNARQYCGAVLALCSARQGQHRVQRGNGTEVPRRLSSRYMHYSETMATAMCPACTGEARAVTLNRVDPEGLDGHVWTSDASEGSNPVRTV